MSSTKKASVVHNLSSNSNNRSGVRPLSPSLGLALSITSTRLTSYALRAFFVADCKPVAESVGVLVADDAMVNVNGVQSSLVVVHMCWLFPV